MTLPEYLDGRYRMIEPLGRGGSAAVWRACDERLNRMVAVKMVRPDQPDLAVVTAEAQALAQLSHPHVANVFDVGECEGRPYLVMELVEGRQLAAVLNDDGLSGAAAVVCLAQIASALAAAHARGLVHRDVTPANVMLTTAGAKLIDFGISAVEGERETDPDGGLRGTPAYVAPERLRDATVAPAGDVYSLGLVLYRALAGRLPWSAGDAREFWAVREVTDPEPLPRLPGIPADVDEVCLQCLATDPASRPDAAELARVLQTAATPEGYAELRQAATATAATAAIEATQLMPRSRSTADSAARRPHRRAWVAVAATASAVVGIGTALSTWTPPGDAVVPGSLAAPDRGLAPPACAVTYRLAADDGERFSAVIDAAGRAEPLRAGWRLSLRLPEASMAIDPANGWQHDADVVISAPQPGVDPGDSAALTLSGTHDGTIALPTRVNVDDRACDVVVLNSAPALTPPASQPPPEKASPAATPPGQLKPAKAQPTGPKPRPPGQHAQDEDS